MRSGKSLHEDVQNQVTEEYGVGRAFHIDSTFLDCSREAAVYSLFWDNVFQNYILTDCNYNWLLWAASTSALHLTKKKLEEGACLIDLAL